MPQVVASLVVQIAASYAFGGTGGTTGGYGNFWGQLIFNVALAYGRHALSSRPPNAVSPSAELLAEHEARIRPNLARLGLGDARRLDLFEGFDPASPTVQAIVSEGQCLEPEFPGGGPLGRTVVMYDTALPVRSGDLAIVENVIARTARRGSGLGGAMTRETSLLVKYAEQKDSGEWVLHSNDEPFLLTSSMRFIGRVTAALVRLMREKPRGP